MIGASQYVAHSSSSSSLHELEESPVPASSIVVVSILFLVYLCLVFRMVDIYVPVLECGYVPFFADVLSIYVVHSLPDIISIFESTMKWTERVARIG
jgi:hypothetical protein